MKKCLHFLKTYFICLSQRDLGVMRFLLLERKTNETSCYNAKNDILSLHLTFPHYVIVLRQEINIFQLQYNGYTIIILPIRWLNSHNVSFYNRISNWKKISALYSLHSFLIWKGLVFFVLCAICSFTNIFLHL